MFPLTFIFLVLVVLLDSQDSATELQKAFETSNVALSEHHLPEEVSGAEINEAGKGCSKLETFQTNKIHKKTNPATIKGEKNPPQTQLNKTQQKLKTKPNQPKKNTEPHTQKKNQTNQAKQTRKHSSKQKPFLKPTPHQPNNAQTTLLYLGGLMSLFID